MTDREPLELAAEAVGWIAGAFTAVVVMGLIGYMQ